MFETASSTSRRRGRIVAGLVLAAVATGMLIAPAASQGAKHKVKVMTRNLYLGANLKPAIKATSLQELVNLAGGFLNTVDKNNFPVRSKGLSGEILDKHPDLVGLQEVALWRTAPCAETPIPPTATHVRYDYLKLLMKRLNAGKKRYRVVISEPEFDFQIWANTDQNESSGSPFGCDIEGRLTYSDVILARRHAGVRTKHARRGHFKELLQVQPAGVTVKIRRGWTRVDAKVRGSRRFRFVEAHLEAYDDQASNHTNQGTDVGPGRIREAQAKELVQKGGPVSGKLPVIMALDVNSDVKTAQEPGDGLAYRALLKAGLRPRSTRHPTYGIEQEVLRTSAGGSISDFDQLIDRVMTDRPKRVKLIESSVTGLRPMNGFWNGDHLGVFSALRIP